MAGPFLGLSMASNALRSFQRALDTTGHNVANVNTKGYSRQTVQFGTNMPLSYFNGARYSVGQGSTITSINRIRDGYLDVSYNSSTSNMGKFEARANGLMALDRTYSEPRDDGIAASLEQMFNAWSALGSNPTDPSARAKVRNAGLQLTNTVRTSYQQFQSIETNAKTSVNSTIGRINTLANSIAELNKEIVKNTVTGGTANDLMDKRDMALNELSSLVNIKKEVFPDGQYAVYAAGFTLVDSVGARTFPNNYDASTGSVTDGAITYFVSSGKLSGDFSTLNETRSQMANLDNLANTLRTQFNAVHSTGINDLGNTGVNFFNDVAVPPQTGAIDFALSTEVLADSRAIVAGTTGNAGDGGLALSLAGMRDTSFAAMGNQSFGQFFQKVVSDLAHQSSYADSAVETESAVLAQIENQIQSVSGVSLDDEMANLLQYQRTYQAAAKMLTVFDEVAQDLIGILRR